MSEKPCNLVRLVFENTMFVQQGEELMFFNEDTFASVMKREIVNVHIFIGQFTDEDVWGEFFEKYLLMMRE